MTSINTKISTNNKYLRIFQNYLQILHNIVCTFKSIICAPIFATISFTIPIEVSVKTPIKGVMAQRVHTFFHLSIPANFVKGKGKYTNLFILGLQKKTPLSKHTCKLCKDGEYINLLEKVDIDVRYP